VREGRSGSGGGGGGERGGALWLTWTAGRSSSRTRKMIAVGPLPLSSVLSSPHSPLVAAARNRKHVSNLAGFAAPVRIVSFPQLEVR